MLKNYHNEMGVCVLFYILFLLYCIVCSPSEYIYVREQVFFYSVSWLNMKGKCEFMRDTTDLLWNRNRVLYFFLVRARQRRVVCCVFG